MIKIEKRCLKMGEKVIYRQSVILSDMQCEIKVDVGRVNEWYDDSFQYTVAGIIKDGLLSFEIPTVDLIDESLYFIGIIEVIDKNTNQSIFLKVFREEKCLSFYISESKKSDEYIEKMFWINRKKREDDFYMYVGDTDIEESNSYIAFIFCKNVYISCHSRYGQIEIVPYKNLDYISEIEYIKSFCKDYGVKLDIKKNKLNLVESHNRPSVVMNIPNILAIDIERAGEIAIGMAENLVNIIGLLRKSHGEIWGVYLIDKKEGKRYFKFVNDGYKGNIINGYPGGENPNEIRELYNLLLINKGNCDIYLSLLNDAIRETDLIKKYYRLWNIIEGIARDKGYQNRYVKRWNGTNVMISYNKHKQKINKRPKKIVTSKELVFELLREYYAKECKEKEVLGSGIEVNNISEFLDVCYRRRNCCVHRGGCFKDNNDICKISDKSYEICNRLINKLNGKDPMNDLIIITLEKIVVEVLKCDLRGCTFIKNSSNTMEIRQHSQDSKFIEL